MEEQSKLSSLFKVVGRIGLERNQTVRNTKIFSDKMHLSPANKPFLTSK